MEEEEEMMMMIENRDNSFILRTFFLRADFGAKFVRLVRLKSVSHRSHALEGDTLLI